MSIESIEYNDIKYGEIIWADTRVEKTTFFSPPESSFQFGLLAHKAGFVELPHYHKPTTLSTFFNRSKLEAEFMSLGFVLVFQDYGSEFFSILSVSETIVHNTFLLKVE